MLEMNLMISTSSLFFLLSSVNLFSISDSASDSFMVPTDANCACLGQMLTFTCNVTGPGITVWDVTAFNCSRNLRHSEYSTSEGISRSCNNGAIVAMSIGVTNVCYASQLIVNVSHSLNNTTIQCTHDSTNMGLREIGSFTFHFMYIPYYLQGPSGIMVSNVNMTEITIRWTEVNSICPDSIRYSVTSNCSGVMCMAIRNVAGVTCSNLPIASMCTFSIRSEVCGQAEMVNNAITVILRRPQANLIPIYSTALPSSITRVMITIENEPFLSISDGVSSFAVIYNFYSDGSIHTFACPECEGVLKCSIDAASFLCPLSNKINTSLSALNGLGQGPISDPTIIGCTNEFVSVQYDSTTSTITCNFLNEADTSIKSCSVVYGLQCDQMVVTGPQKNSTVENPNSVTLKVDSKNFKCYSVTASNGSFTVIVEETISVDMGDANTGVIVGITIGVIGVIMVSAVSAVLVVLLIIVVMNLKRKRIRSTTQQVVQQPWKVDTNFDEEFRAVQSGVRRDVEHFQLEEVSKDDFKVIVLSRMYKPKELSEELKSKVAVPIGCSFYEFKGELENIPEQKRIILMNEEEMKLYSSNITSLKGNLSYTEKWKNLRTLLNNFKIFVESTESDEGYLEAETTVIYEIHKTETSTVMVTDNAAEDAGNTNISAAKDGKPTAKDGTENDSKPLAKDDPGDTSKPTYYM